MYNYNYFFSARVNWKPQVACGCRLRLRQAQSSSHWNLKLVLHLAVRLSSLCQQFLWWVSHLWMTRPKNNCFVINNWCFDKQLIHFKNNFTASSTSHFFVYCILLYNDCPMILQIIIISLISSSSQLRLTGRLRPLIGKLVNQELLLYFMTVNFIYRSLTVKEVGPSCQMHLLC